MTVFPAKKSEKRAEVKKLLLYLTFFIRKGNIFRHEVIRNEYFIRYLINH